MDIYEQYSLLETISMSELYEKTYRPNPPLIDGFLYQGVYLFVGAPKLGKSFFMLQLAYHVSTGTDLWNYHVRKGKVLYLALEDNNRRLQERLYRMFGEESTPDLFISTSAKTFDDGLLEQIQIFINENPEISLVIIDTLQMIRADFTDKYSYSKDYDIIREMKDFASENGICLMLVHHTRKQQADDKFDMISGTNGLMGAADGAFMLYKEKRSATSAVIEVSGRDQPDMKVHITRDIASLAWNAEKIEVESFAPEPEPLLEAVAKFITPENPVWCGTATELLEHIKLDIPPNKITTRLNINAGRLHDEYSIDYASMRKSSARLLAFRLIDDNQ